MPKNITQYDLLISCPGDIEEEINLINEVVSNFNQQFSNSLGISIQTRHWSKSSYPQSGGKPQELLNEQFVRDCDAAVAIFWTRFGTPTDEYKSGSEEEIEIMLNSGKQVFLYFCEKPIKPGYDNVQYQQVQTFREKYKDKGIYWTYDSDKQFREFFNGHLTQYFLSKNKTVTKPVLAIKSISEINDIVDTLLVQKFLVPNPITFDERLEQIKKDIHLINSIHLYKAQNEILPSENLNSSVIKISSVSNFLSEEISIEENTKQIIIDFANNQNISLSIDFFDLGQLQKDLASGLISITNGGGIVLKGTPREKQKWEEIYKLKDEIVDFLLWRGVEKHFKDLCITKLILENSGNSYDEDIDIEIYFPNSMIRMHKDLPIPAPSIIKLFENEYSFSDIFLIPQTEKYADYNSSVKEIKFSPTTVESVLGKDNSRDKKHYISKLNEVFCYGIFIKDGNCILKLHMDYIKQHTAIAFPTPIFINKDYLVKNIKYRIISKNNPDIVQGILTVEEIL